jgi:hypothetical protein
MRLHYIHFHLFIFVFHECITSESSVGDALVRVYFLRAVEICMHHSQDGNTALIRAAENGYAGCLRLLLQGRADMGAIGKVRCSIRLYYNLPFLMLEESYCIFCWRS